MTETVRGRGEAASAAPQVGVTEAGSGMLETEGAHVQRPSPKLDGERKGRKGPGSNSDSFTCSNR